MSGNLKLSLTLDAKTGKLKGNLHDAEISLKGFSKQAEQSGRKASHAFSKTREGVSGLRSELLALAVPYVGFAAISSGIRAIAESGMELQAIQSKLSVSTKTVGVELSYIGGVADRLGLSMRATAGAYASFAAATQGTNMEGAKTRKVFEGIATASSAMGLSADATSGALKALEQMVSKGTVSAEELRGQLGERIPGAFGLAAKAMGVTTKELGKMLDNGELLASDLLPRLADEMQNKFGQAASDATSNLRQETARLSNAFDSLTAAIFDNGAGAAMAWFVRLEKNGLEGMTALINVMSNADEQSAVAIQIVNTSEALRKLQERKDAFIKNDKDSPILTWLDARPRLNLDKKIAAAEAKIKSLTNRRALILNPEDVYANAMAAGSSEAEARAIAAGQRVADAYNKGLGKGKGGKGNDNKPTKKQGMLSIKNAASMTQQLSTSFDDSFTKISDKYVTTWESLVATQGEGSAKVKALESAYQGWLDGLDQQRIVKEQAKNVQIIDIHSAKFARIDAMGKAAFGSDKEKLVAALDVKQQLLKQEEDRTVAAIEAQGGNTANVRAYFDGQRISAAQKVADKLGAIEQTATDKALAIKQQEIDARNALIATGEQAATDLKGQFQQLVSDNQQVHLATLSSNMMSYTDALWQTNKQSGERELAWSKFTGSQKLQFAASSLGALSGLMKSHSRKQFEVGKAAAQGENAINTYMGATKAYASMAGIPYVGPVLGAIAAAAIIAAGVANAQKINSAKMGGSTGGVAIPTMSAGGGGGAPTLGMNAQTGLPQNAPKQAPQATLNVTINAPAGLTDPTVAQSLADALAPHIQNSFTTGRSLQQAMV